MSYTINLTNGNLFATIADGTINTSSSQTLVGKNYAGYGQFLNDNFIHLLENASDTTPPGAPLTGQLWWDSGNSLLKVYNGSTFKTISSTTAQSTAPTNNVTGDLWFDTTNQQLNVWTGSQWLVVGPAYSGGTGITGAIPTTIVDNTAVSHVVIELYVANSIVGIVSKDAVFTPQVAIPGFATISPGIQLATLVGSQVPLFQGIAVNSQQLGGLPANAYITSGNSSSSFSGAVTLNTGGGATAALINGATPGVGNIGSVGTPFNFVFATATQAQYADVAERFHADTELSPGTVVELGGTAEITQVNSDLSENVFGVISTKAAYLMNCAAGSDATHPPVAMTGRVPVRVVGQINKGDRLVSAGNGLARAAQAGEATAFNVIGRALAAKTTTAEGTVEAIVTIK